MNRIGKSAGAAGLSWLAIFLFVSLAYTGSFQLSGLVKDKLSIPVAGATVEALDPVTLEAIASTTTGADGRYGLPLAAGTYAIRVLPPAESGLGQALTGERVIDRDTVIDFVLVPAGTARLSGRLTTGHGAVVGGFPIAVTAAGAPSGETITTESDGSYSIDLAPGSYNLSHYGYETMAGLPTLLQFASVAFTVSASQVLDVVLPLKEITVTVLDPFGQPVTGVQIETSQGGSPFTTGGVYFDSYCGYLYYSGPFPITGADGKVTLWLYPNQDNSYVFAAHPPQGSPYATTTIQVEVHDDMAVDLTLAEPVTLSGHLTTEHGLAVGGLPITVTAAGAPTGQTITTETDGSFSIDLAPGSYNLSHYGYETMAGLPTLLQFASAPFPITGDLHLDLVLPLKQVTITVQDPFGQPVEGVQIETSQGGSPFTTGGVYFDSYCGYLYYSGPFPITGADGKVTLWLLPNQDNSYVFAATPPQGSPYATTTIQVEVHDDRTVDLTLAEAVTLSGQLTTEHGLAIGGFPIAVTAAGAPSGQAVTTGPDGSFSIDLAPGSYNLSHYGYETMAGLPTLLQFASAPFPITGDLHLDLVLPLKQVTITVQDPYGLPVAGVQIETSQGGSPFTTGGVYFDSYCGYLYYSGPFPVTSADGKVTLWLYPNQDNAYVFAATPPDAQTFGKLTLPGISITGDQEIIIALQFAHDPPVSTLLLAPDPDENGRYANLTTVTLSAEAAQGYSVAGIPYRVDGGAEQEYSGPFQVSGYGWHTIRYSAVDNAGVYEAPRARTFRVGYSIYVPVIRR